MKLVRDRIPEIIIDSGMTPVVSNGKGKHFSFLLYSKLVEELGEFYNDNDNISIELMMFILNNCNSNNYINNIKPSIKGIEIIDLVNENNNSLSECGVCLQSNIRNKDMIEFDCNHNLCNRCTNKIMDMNKNLCCPYCRHNISSIKYSYGVELSFNIEK